ncbi:phosphatase PAP2 family protein [Dietzia aurantiaca]|uniref:Phosphatase PAP2 family protein n=1 Tax=Dietzia aurantiaca TaxID=983873 RepID=A0ABV9PRW7_9ACTN
MPTPSLSDPHGSPAEPAPPPRSWLHLAAAGLMFLLPLLVFVSLASDVVTFGALPYDRSIMVWLNERASPVVTTTMMAATELGGLVVVPIIAVVWAGLLWWGGRRRDAALLGAAVIGSTLLNTALKAVFQRDRPDFWEHLVVEHSYSFPSGHAMASMSLAASLVVIAWSTRWRWAAIDVGAVYVLVVGLSRIYLGVHFPSDILAGWCVAVLWVTVVVTVLDGASRRRRAGRPGPWVGPVGGSPEGVGPAGGGAS